MLKGNVWVQFFGAPGLALSAGGLWRGGPSQNRSGALVDGRMDGYLPRSWRAPSLWAKQALVNFSRTSQPKVVFSFLYLKKIKISKIYPGRPMGATWLKCNFFSSNLQRSLWRKKERGPVAPPTGDRVPHLSHYICHLSLKIQKKRER